MSELAEIVIHFVSNGGLVPRKAVECHEGKRGRSWAVWLFPFGVEGMIVERGVLCYSGVGSGVQQVVVPRRAR